MNEEQKHSMLIHFNDGSKKLLEFSAPVADNDANLGAVGERFFRYAAALRACGRPRRPPLQAARIAIRGGHPPRGARRRGRAPRG